MANWDNAVKTALLGTERQQLQTQELPEPLQQYLMQLVPADREDAFLKTAAFLLNYEQAGRQLPVVNFNLPQLAGAEEKATCSEMATQTLAAILEEGDRDLLLLWIKACERKQQLVRPDYIPALLQEGKKMLYLRPLVQQITGHRGSWLATQNEEWQYLNQTDQEVWEHGRPEERRHLLYALRAQNPEEARKQLQAGWKEENANSRADLLAALSANLSLADEPWLLELLSDKSQKVRTAAGKLLQELPGSAWMDEIWNEAKNWIRIQKSKSFIGISKEELVVLVPDKLPADLKQKGIEEVSSEKGVTDQEFWLSEVLERIPPYYWEKHLALSPEKILQLFYKHKLLQKSITALVIATSRFQNQKWAKVLLDGKMDNEKWAVIASESLLHDLLGLQGEKAQANYYQNGLYKKDFPFRLWPLDLLQKLNFDWDLPFSLQVIKELTKQFSETTVYNSFYQIKELYRQLHPDLLLHLRELEPADPAFAQRWHSQLTKLFRLLDLRKQLHKSFEQ